MERNETGIYIYDVGELGRKVWVGIEDESVLLSFPKEKLMLKILV